MQQPPQEIVIGIPNRTGRQMFNDAIPLQSQPFPQKISKLIIQYDKDNIWGLKFYYKCGSNNKEVKGESSLKFKPLRSLFTSLKKEKLVIPDDDYIMEIFGYADTEIRQIGFITYKGLKKVCGTQIGAFFKYVFPQHTFIAAKGSFDRYLDFVCFKVVRLPETAIMQYCPSFDITIMNQTVPYQNPTQTNNNQQYSMSLPQQQYPPQQQYNPPPPPVYPAQQGQYQYPPQQYPQPPPQQYPPPPQYPPVNQYPQQSQPYPPPPQQYPQNYQKPPVVYPQPQQPTTTIIIEKQAPPPSRGPGIGGAILGAALIGAAIDNRHHHHHHHHHHGHRRHH